MPDVPGHEHTRIELHFSHGLKFGKAVEMSGTCLTAEDAAVSVSLGAETVVSGNRTFSAARIVPQSVETEADILISGT